MPDNSPAEGDTRLFFQHIMKTAGTSFVTVLEANTDETFRYPGPKGQRRRLDYVLIDNLRAWVLEHPETRVFFGHFPSVAGDIVRADVRLTLLREPIGRIVSALHHFRRTDPRLHAMSLEEIYEDEYTSAFYLRNHQVKMFAMTPDDALESLMDVVEIDARRLAIAKQNLAAFDLVGFTQDYESFVDAVCKRFAWTVRPTARLQVGPSLPSIPPMLLRRIEADNAADIEFFEHALSLKSNAY